MAVLAFNTRLVVPGKLDGIGWFTLETVQRMVSAHPEHEFHLLFDRRPPVDLFPGDNVKCHRVWPPARRPFLQDLWFDHAVPPLLRRIGADMFISPDGFLSKRTVVPEVVVQHDLNFEHHPEWLPERVADHYRKRFPDAARRAVRVATVSRYSAQDISNRYGVAPDHIDVVYNGAGAAYHSLPVALNAQQSRARAQARFTQGRPYFIFIGTQHPRKNLGGLLDAFAAYRDQGGKWDLLLVGTALWRRRGFDARGPMGNIPAAVRDHVHQAGWLPQSELAEVLAAAMCMVFIPWFEGFGIPMVEAFAAGTPVIHGDRTSLPEVAEGAGLSVDPGDAPAVASAMLRMEREPALRKELIERGRHRADDFSWDRTAALLWACIERAAGDVGLELKAGQRSGQIAG